MKQLAAFLSGGIVSVWLFIYLTAAGVLVYRAGPYAGAGFGQKQLDCAYLHSTGLVTKTYLYSSNGLIGRTVCPRLELLG